MVVSYGVQNYKKIMTYHQKLLKRTQRLIINIKNLASLCLCNFAFSIYIFQFIPFLYKKIV